MYVEYGGELKHGGLCLVGSKQPYVTAHTKHFSTYMPNEESNSVLGCDYILVLEHECKLTFED